MMPLKWIAQEYQVQRGFIIIRLFLLGVCLMVLAGCHRESPTVAEQLRLIAESDESPSEKGKQLAPLVQLGMNIDDLRKILGEGEMWLSPSLGGGGVVGYYDLGLAVDFADGKVTSVSCNHPLLRHLERESREGVPSESSIGASAINCCSAAIPRRLNLPEHALKSRAMRTQSTNPAEKQSPPAGSSYRSMKQLVDKRRKCLYNNADGVFGRDIHDGSEDCLRNRPLSSSTFCAARRPTPACTPRRS